MERDRDAEALALAEASVREAEAMMASVLAPAPERTVRERPPRERPRPRPVKDRIRAVPVHLRALQWTRRQAAGAALTVAFVPVGWVVGAALLSSDEASGLAPVAANAPDDSHVTPHDFRLAKATGKREPGTTLSAYARGRSVRVHAKPGGKQPERLRQRVIEGQAVPLVFLVERRRPGWLKVQLPIRPNLSTAWIRKSDVRLRANPFRVRVNLAEHRLTVWRGRNRVATRKVGIGQTLSPTPTGRYYVTDLIKARNPDDLYGPYSFGLSAHSPVYDSFRGGEGQIGLHGTNDPAALGSDVSAGCIRLNNRTITRLAKQLPLGTPVIIRS